MKRQSGASMRTWENGMPFSASGRSGFSVRESVASQAAFSQKRRGVERLGLHDRQSGTIARAARDGIAVHGRARDDPFQSVEIQHCGRD